MSAAAVSSAAVAVECFDTSAAVRSSSAAVIVAAG